MTADKKRDIYDFFLCEKDDCFISREKFPPVKKGFFDPTLVFRCPICEAVCEEVNTDKTDG